MSIIMPKVLNGFSLEFEMEGFDLTPISIE